MPESAKCSASARWQRRHTVVDGPAAHADIAVRQNQDKTPRGMLPSYSSLRPIPRSPRAIPGNRTAMPDRCHVERWMPSSASSNISSGFTAETGSPARKCARATATHVTLDELRTGASLLHPKREESRSC
jgi:hypothetical protein